ncbi:hypothetical protein [Shimia sp. SK013]|nr:hypothetical protein [Shimia sp. SK013]
MQKFQAATPVHPRHGSLQRREVAESDHLVENEPKLLARLTYE